MHKKRDAKNYGTGHDDGLEPLVPLDIGRLDSIDALVTAMSKTAFGGRRLGEAADALEAMIRDEDCFRGKELPGFIGIKMLSFIERLREGVIPYYQTKKSPAGKRKITKI